MNENIRYGEYQYQNEKKLIESVINFTVCFELGMIVTFSNTVGVPLISSKRQLFAYFISCCGFPGVFIQGRVFLLEAKVEFLVCRENFLH